MIFANKINKIPKFYMIFARKMPEFYMIIAREFFYRIWGTCDPPLELLPPSPTPMHKNLICTKLSVAASCVHKSKKSGR